MRAPARTLSKLGAPVVWAMNWSTASWADPNTRRDVSTTVSFTEDAARRKVASAPLMASMAA